MQIMLNNNDNRNMNSLNSGTRHESCGSRLTYFVFSYIFVMLLATPFVFAVSGHDVSLQSVIENRTLAGAPDLKTTPVKDLPKLWDQFFRDKMPFRQVFMPWYLYVYEKVLQSPVSEYVTGKGSDIFMNHAEPLVDRALGVRPYPDDAREQIRLTAAGKYAYFRSKGIPFYLFLAPDKTTMYPELLPFYAEWIPHRTWYEEQVSTLNKANINFYPLKDFLWQFKNNERLYDAMFDTGHWNGNALVHVYDHMAKILSRDNPIFTPVAYNEYYGLEKVHVFASVYGSEDTEFIRLKHTDDFSCSMLPEQYRTDNYNLACINDKVKSGSLWFFSDSYFGGTHGSDTVTPFIHNVHTYIHRHYGMGDRPFTALADETLRLSRPDAVIEEFVERMTGTRHCWFDPKLRILGDYWMKTRGIFLEHKTDLSAFNIQNIGISKSDPALLSVKADNHLTPRSAVDADDLGRVVIMGIIDAPENALINVRFKETAADAWQEINFSLKKDQKIFHETIRVKPFAKVNLSLQFRTPGKYRLEKIQEIDDLRERM